VPPPPPPPNERKRAEVNAGTIVGVFGVRGELKLDASRIGDDALRAGLLVTLEHRDGRRSPATVASIRRHQGRPLVAFAGLADADAAQTVVGARVLVARDAVELGDGEYFDDDLIGCRLIDAHGTPRGRVVDVLHYPSQDMLVVGPARTLVPLVGAFVVRIDVARKEIVVDVPEGLLDPAAADEA
jgi:16S rRNA processing protein RimM